MTEGEPYRVETNRTVRRALSETLPVDVVTAVMEFFAAALTQFPHRVGKELGAPYAGVYSARVMRVWRVLYRIDDSARLVEVLDVRHRRDAYKT